MVFSLCFGLVFFSFFLSPFRPPIHVLRSEQLSLSHGLSPGARDANLYIYLSNALQTTTFKIFRSHFSRFIQPLLNANELFTNNYPMILNSHGKLLTTIDCERKIRRGFSCIVRLIYCAAFRIYVLAPNLFSLVKYFYRHLQCNRHSY